MNEIIRDYWPLFEMYQSLRDQAMTLLTDDDLGFRLGGATTTIGQLCRKIGDTEYSYIDSFKTFRHDYSLRDGSFDQDMSVAALNAWYADLDRQLKTTIEALSADDLANRVIDRGGDFVLPPRIQLEVYKEALLIFYGKLNVYLKALDKPLPKQWQEWIG